MTSDELYSRLRRDHFIIAGPCALESFELALDTARAVAEATAAGIGPADLHAMLDLLLEED